ncbi:MAG: gamma-glutamyltransferase [Gemmatimonadota bacterium]
MHYSDRLLAEHGSAVTLEAIRNYRAEDARILRGTYRGYEIVGMDVPAAGAVVIQALNILQNLDPGTMSPAQWSAVVGQAVGLASRELPGLGTDTAAARAISTEWARTLIKELRVPEGVLPDEGTRPPADPRAAFHAPRPLPLGARGDDDGHTTHLTVADSSGMMVALTQTLGPNMGSKVVTPGLGFLYASTLGGYLGPMEPGERARSFISPVIVLKDGVPVLALEAPRGLFPRPRGGL